MTRFLSWLLLPVVLVAGVPSQVHIVHESGKRNSTRLAYLGGVDRPGEAYLSYGVATWRKEYESEIEKPAAAHFRVGSGYWASLHTSLQLELGGKVVPANIWYVGLQRSAKAAWSLTLMDASKVMRLGLNSGATRDVKPDLVIEGQFRKRPAEVLPKDRPTTAQLDIRFEADETEFGEGLLRLRWGGHELSVPFRAKVKQVRPEGEPKFRKLDPARTVRTASGLEYEELRAGVGTPPTKKGKVTAHYVGWHADGRRLDSSFTVKRPVQFELNSVIPGWREALLRMRPGAVFLVRIPPQLGYGEAGAGQVKPNETLVFWIELRAIE